MDSNEPKTESKTSMTEKETFTLTPLNIRKLRTQLLEHMQAQMEDISESDENDDEDSTDTDCKQEDQSEPKSNNIDTQETEKQTEISEYSSMSTHEHLSINEKEPLNPLVTRQNKENIPMPEESLRLSKTKMKNDSFDLDFSALSIHTPVKRKDNNFNFATPRINIIPSSETKSIKKSSQLFLTPKVNTFRNIEKSVLKTPLSNALSVVPYSAKKLGETPYKIVNAPPHNISVARRDNIPPSIYDSGEYPRYSVNNNEYIMMNMLGRGGSSEVYHCFHPEEKIHVAIKVVNLSNSSTAEGYINEVKLLESLQSCDRIIKMYDFEVQGDQLVVVMEKGGEDLSTILKQLAANKSYLPNYMLLFYWMEMLYAVRQIHMNGIIHSDLKPANFICVERGLKLIDFGIASKVQEDMTCVYKSNQEGSCNYISPEALQTYDNTGSPNYGKPKYKIHFKSDVWSLGCILYQLVYRITPFQHVNQLWAKLAAITNTKFVINYPSADWVSTKIITTIKRCLQHDVKSRPSVDELIEEYELLLKNL